MVNKSSRWYVFAYVDRGFFTKEYLNYSSVLYQSEEHFREAQNIAPERLVIRSNFYFDFPLLQEKDFESLKEFMDVRAYEAGVHKKENCQRMKDLIEKVDNLERYIDILLNETDEERKRRIYRQEMLKFYKNDQI